MAASQYAVKEFGGKVRPVENPVTDSVSQAAKLILRNNPDRIGWLVVNLSGSSVYVGYSPTVSSTRGILLSAGGGSASSTVAEDGESVAWELWAIGAADNLAIYVVEYVVEE